MISVEQARQHSQVETWIAFFKTADIPVLRQTAREILKLKENDDAGTRDIAVVILNDPMMVFKVLTYAQNHKGRHQLQDLVQVEQALMMMGMTTFFTKIPPSPLVEEVLQDDLTTLMDLLKLIVRAHRASHYAAEFASHLVDLHAEEVRVAALLYDLSEMLMMCFDRQKMNVIAKRKKADPTLRSKVVQKEVLGFELIELQLGLVEAFQLPPLLAQLMSPQSVNMQRVKNVQIAVNLARHSASGWDDAALPDDYKDVASLLRVDIDRAKHIIGVPKAN